MDEQYDLLGLIGEEVENVPSMHRVKASEWRVHHERYRAIRVVVQGCDKRESDQLLLASRSLGSGLAVMTEDLETVVGVDAQLAEIWVVRKPLKRRRSVGFDSGAKPVPKALHHGSVER